MNIGVLNGKSESLETILTEFVLEAIDDEIDIKVLALTVDRVTSNIEAISCKLLANKWNNLKDIAFPIIGPRPIINLLISIDYADLHCFIKKIKRRPGELTARLTPLGLECIEHINNAKKNKNKYPLAAETVLYSTYMDGSMDLVKTSDEVIKLYQDFSELWGKAGMYARKCISNESEVLNKITEEDREMEVNLKCGEFLSVKALAILWESKDDAFAFKDASLPCCKEIEYTKQIFLKNIATLLDPLGLL